MNSVERYLPAVKLGIRLALICSSAMVFAFILLFLLGWDDFEADRWYGIIVWYALLFSMWTLFCSVPLLLSIALYRGWQSVKRETILLAINVAVIALTFLIVKFT